MNQVPLDAVRYRSRGGPQVAQLAPRTASSDLPPRRGGFRASGILAEPLAKAQMHELPALASALVEIGTKVQSFNPEVVVTAERLAAMRDLWTASTPKECKDPLPCSCQRCVTMDLLAMTQVIDVALFDAALEKLDAFIDRVCGKRTWAFASLLPGKSNFWLMARLVRMRQKRGGALPSELYLTQVNDIRPFLPYHWNAVYGVPRPKIEHVIVVDDVSYSGTQLASLAARVIANVGSAQVHLCPLFITPHAAMALPSTRTCELWDNANVLEDNASMFSRHNNTRRSNAASFSDLCTAYARVWSDCRAMEHSKTLTTTLPYYKIPDHFSCPVRVYLAPKSHLHEECSAVLSSAIAPGQNPGYQQFVVAALAAAR